MAKRVKFQGMLDSVRQSLKKIPEHRTGHYRQYEISGAGLGAFALFYVQLSNFLAHQRHMEE